MAIRKPKRAKSAGEQIGLRLLRSVRDMKAGQAARKTKIELNEVVKARENTGMSQSEFAEALNISKRTLQEWEQGRRAPSGAARTLLLVAERNPRALLDVASRTWPSAARPLAAKASSTS